MSSPRIEELRVRTAPLEMTEDQFRALGHDLVDRVAGFLASIRTYPVTAATSPEEVRASLDAARALPERRQYGQSDVLPGCPGRASRLGRPQARRRWWPSALCLRLRGNSHMDPQG